MSRFVLGIDPGLKGALAFYNPETGGLDVEDMPTLKSGGAKGKTAVDRAALARLIDVRAKDIVHCYLEKAGPQPLDGVVGAFTSGRGYGLLEGILTAHFVPLTIVPPADWKKTMGCTGDKQQSTARAGELLPRHATKFCGPKGGIKDGRAEAAVLAVFGARQLALQTLTAA